MDTYLKFGYFTITKLKTTMIAFTSLDGGFLLYIIHLFWQQLNDNFVNKGQFYLWVETQNSTNKKNFYPYQLKSNTLQNWFKQEFQLTVRTDETLVALPCNKSGLAVPSPIIGNLNDLQDVQPTDYRSFTLNTILIEAPIKFLKELNFKSYYLEENCKLSDDCRFWLNMAYELSAMIKKDQYIPCLVAEKVKNQIRYYSKWEPMSLEFQSKIEKIAKLMPLSASLSESTYVNPVSVLQHFSEAALTDFIATTCYSQKTIKLFDNTFIQHGFAQNYFNPEYFDLPDSIWKDWKIWKNNLAYDQFGVPFQVCFRLNSATDSHTNNWSLQVLIQSKSDPSFMITLSDYWIDKKSKKTLFSKMFGTSVEKNLLLQIGYASRIYSLLDQVFENNMQSETLPLSTQQAFSFLKEDAWALHACGYRIIVPSWWTSKGRLKAKLKMRASQSSQSVDEKPNAYFHKEGLINFDYRYAIGEHEVSKKEWQQLIESKSELVYFRGTWIEIDALEMQKMKQLIKSSSQDKKTGSMKDLLAMSAEEELYEVEYDQAIEQMLSQLQDKNQLKAVLPPDTLKATLRPYQARGLSWMSYLENIGMNPCLADDMGLGKTMQVIALLLTHPKVAPALLVAPTSVVGNWQREVEKFAPSLKVIVHHGSKRTMADDFSKLAVDYNLVITSYGLIRRDKTLFNQLQWSRLIIDEAQNIKNPAATQTKLLCQISADSKIALTGTPVENRLMDLWSVFNFLNPGYLGARSHFRKNFELPVQRENDPTQTRVLKNLVEPFILRRLKTDKNIIQDLPDKIEQKVYCELTKEQASIYQSIVDEVAQKMSKAEDNIQQRAIILSALLRLKQCCNHPAQVLQDNSAFSPDRSIKLQRLIEMTSEVINNGESLLVFSQFKEICDALNHVLKTQYGYQTYYLHGGTSRKKREEMITQFQTPATPPSIFVLSLKAGGIGITLTRANHVIHFDRWWNPAVENQATDRAYRIGQEKTVFAHKFITMGTIEERIDQMLEDKQKISDMIVGSDESWLSSLNAKSFMNLIRLSRSTVQDKSEVVDYA